MAAKRETQFWEWPYAENAEHPSNTKHCRGVVSASNSAIGRTTVFVHEAGELPLTDFYANQYNKDGLGATCAMCESAYRKLRAKVRAAAPNDLHYCNGAHGFGAHIVTGADMPRTSSTSLCALHSNAASKGLIISAELYAAIWNSQYGLCGWCTRPLKLNSATIYRKKGGPPTIPWGISCKCAPYRAATREIPPVASAILAQHAEMLAALDGLGISPRRALEMLGVEAADGTP